MKVSWLTLVAFAFIAIIGLFSYQSHRQTVREFAVLEAKIDSLECDIDELKMTISIMQMTDEVQTNFIIKLYDSFETQMKINDLLSEY